jgi:hypothetical protein
MDNISSASMVTQDFDGGQFEDIFENDHSEHDADSSSIGSCCSDQSFVSNIYNHINHGDANANANDVSTDGQSSTLTTDQNHIRLDQVIEAEPARVKHGPPGTVSIQTAHPLDFMMCVGGSGSVSDGQDQASRTLALLSNHRHQEESSLQCWEPVPLPKNSNSSRHTSIAMNGPRGQAVALQKRTSCAERLLARMTRSLQSGSHVQESYVKLNLCMRHPVLIHKSLQSRLRLRGALTLFVQGQRNRNKDVMVRHQERSRVPQQSQCQLPSTATNHKITSSSKGMLAFHSQVDETKAVINYKHEMVVPQEQGAYGMMCAPL